MATTGRKKQGPATPERIRENYPKLPPDPAAGITFTELIVRAVAFYAQTAAEKRGITYLEALRGLGLVKRDDEETDSALYSLDITLAAEGDAYFRAWLARSESMRAICERYRPAIWERLKPSATEIKRETGKWNRECALAEKRKREPETTVAGR